MSPERRARSAMITVGLCLGLLSAPAWPDTAYRWTDADGTVHVSDHAPAGIEAERIELEQTPTVAPVEDRDARATGTPQDAAPRGGIGGVISNADPLDNESECDRRWREYFDSQACFAPYQRVGAGPREEAYEKCTEVPSPEVDCGPPRHFPDEDR